MRKQHGHWSLFFETVIATCVFIGLLRALRYVSWGPVHEYNSVIFFVVAIYGAILVLRWRKRPIDFLETSVGQAARSVWIFSVFSLIIFPPYLLAAHVWQHVVYDVSLKLPIAMWPGWDLIIGQMLLVALPEEFFFRGYVQSTLDKVFAAKWKIVGTKLGWSWILTAAIFAVAHSVIQYQWWHFAIFFPGLAFGYLRARTGGLIAPMLFHALSNIIMWWLGVTYM